MASLNLERLLFDPADADGEGSPNIGAFIRAAGGELITSTLVSGKQALDVNLVSDADDGIFAEDVASTTGDKGQSILQVRQDALSSSVSTDGDYGWFKMNARGALWTAPVGTVADDAADTENPVKVGSRAVSGALAAVASGDRADLLSDLYRRVYVNDSPNIAAASTLVTVDVTEVALPASALPGRRRMMIQNVSDKDIFVGPTGVAISGATRGISISKGGTLALEVGQNVALFAICSAAAKDVVVFELA